jgi:hypothetical protein
MTSLSQATGTWSGHNEYLAYDTSEAGAQRLRLNRWFTIQIGRDGIVYGSARLVYGEPAASRLFERKENIMGRFDPVTRKMVLAIKTPRFTSRKPQATDSTRYSYTLTQVGDSLMMTMEKDDKKAVDYQFHIATKSWIVSLLPSHLLVGYSKPVPAVPTRDTATVQVPVRSEEIQPVFRERDIQHTIVLDTTVIRLDLYDNGQVDNDTATLLLDGKTIIRRQLLTTKPVSLSLELSRETTEHLLEMFADNLGSIPPNTALLVLTCKGKRYELNLSSNGKVNGSVKLLVRP